MPRKTAPAQFAIERGEVASMRPRPDAAENLRDDAVVPPENPLASMRPRPDAAENHALQDEQEVGLEPASMRPRPDAAENRRPPASGSGSPRPRFNEAAARCRGKPPINWSPCHPRGCASMRPRPDAAENRARCPPPARCCGCFNEAAARCRGKPAGADDGRAGRRPASMRPRPDAAENPSTR